MKLKEITVNVCQKVGTPNYGSKRFGLTATAELAEGDDLLRVKQELTNKLNTMLDFEIKKIQGNGGQK